ncbi:NAD(P)H-binding protein [Paenibacillus sp. HWE-109]|uniref:NAD(P)H-binding protein n=1 Tax=Paenibacillus sp. HWE-109 TaxID=1306526 RepID=UPI001EDD3D47|nr:NAD(P)H-binding protein [Paenibacillus sp. HWE-109]UKS27995.1 NAD(P)H-binding protein [Paenibacillus sp. HWE-109]
MLKGMVVRAGSGWGRVLVKRLIEENVEVVAYSSSQRKLETLQMNISSPLLRIVRGDVGNPDELLDAANGVNVIFCGVYLTYDDKPEKVHQMLEFVRSVSAAIGAKLVIVEGVYRPADVKESANVPCPNSMRIFSPELYGEAASNTLIHYALRKIVQGKSVKLPIDPSIRRDYLFVDDAARYAYELASTESAYGGNWHLCGNGSISQAELLDFAGSVVQVAPRFESIGRLQQRLLQWYEPKTRIELVNYERLGKDYGTTSMAYDGVSPTSYQEGIALTVKHMMDKYVAKESTGS